MKHTRLQLFACLLGLVAGFVPNISLTGSFWELSLSQFGDGPVRIDRVYSGSPAERVGLRAGDTILHSQGFEGLHADLRDLKVGEKQTILIGRNDQKSEIELTGVTPELAAIWYADVWYPIAGVVFLVLAVLVYATEPLVPVPLWRAVILCIMGLCLLAGFIIAIIGGSVFSRLRVWQRWMMGSGVEWTFGQGSIGIIAAVLLTVFALVEIRKRLSLQP